MHEFNRGSRVIAENRKAISTIVARRRPRTHEYLFVIDCRHEDTYEMEYCAREIRVKRCATNTFLRRL